MPVESSSFSTGASRNARTTLSSTVPVARPANAETTALGAAYAAGIATGYYGGLDHIRTLWAEDHRWEPAMAQDDRDRLYSRWQQAVERTYGWVE